MVLVRLEIGIVWVKWSEGDCADDFVMRQVADVLAMIKDDGDIRSNASTS